MAKAKSYAVDVPSAKQWQAECDLRTLIEAERIENDPARLKAAKAYAKKRKQELVEELGATAKVESDKD